MNFYLAGRLGAGEGTIGEFSDELEGRGHLVLEKWFNQGRLPKPYLENIETNGVAARSMIKAAFACDAFVLFPEDTVLGAAVELGAALGSTVLREDKQVIIVNPYDVRQSVFYTHPAVTVVESIDQIRKLTWY